MVSGSGTSGDPYILSSFSDLELLGTAPYTLDKYFKLGADIDASATQDAGYNGGAGWLPRGTLSKPFDGNDYKITGLFINRSTTDNVGLFSIINGDGSVINLTLEEVDITGQDYTGGLFGYCTAGGHYAADWFNDVTVKGTIHGRSYVGGIGGRFGTNGYGKPMSYCNFDGDVYATSYIGGIFGRVDNYHNISYCTVKGSLSVTGDRIGGIIGYWATQGDSAYLTHCDVYGSELTINASSTSNFIGGIVGYTGGYAPGLTYCHNYGVDLSGQDYIGGIGGRIGDGCYGVNVNNCSFEDGTISGRSYLGGIVGDYPDNRTLSYCSIRNIVINATGSYIGGIAGACTCTYVLSHLYVTTGQLTINASATSDYIGGIVGWATNTNTNGGVIEYCGVIGISLTGRDYIGGVAGRVGSNGYGGNNNYCFAKEVSIVGRNYIGGYVGYWDTYIGSPNYCFSSGSVSDSGSNGSYQGGWCGAMNTNCYNCYSSCSINGYSHVGGFVGRVTGRTINKCYSRGVVSGTSNVGGLVGSSAGSATDCFWDTQTSGQATSALGTGKTTEEMKTQATYTNWDFTTVPVWYINADKEGGYPYLKSVPNLLLISSITSNETVPEIIVNLASTSLTLELLGIDSSESVSNILVTSIYTILVNSVLTNENVENIKILYKILMNSIVSLEDVSQINIVYKIILDSILSDESVENLSVLYKVILESILSNEDVGLITVKIDQYLKLNSILSDEEVSNPKLSMRILLESIVSGELVENPRLALKIILDSIISTELISLPKLVYRLLMSSIESTEVVSNINIKSITRIILDSIISGEDVGDIKLIIKVIMESIISSEVVGNPIIKWDQFILLNGLISGELIGLPLLYHFYHSSEADVTLKATITSFNLKNVTTTITFKEAPETIFDMID